MTPEDAGFVAELCAARAGLVVDPAKLYLIESRLAPVARREHFTSLPDFLAAVRHKREERLVWALVEALAPPAPDFFRDPAVFDSLAREIAARARRLASPVRCWAAGGAQEAYSLAMAVQEAGVLPMVEIVGSDLSERRVEKARTGVFSQFEVQRGLNARRLVAHFERHDEHFQIAEALRQAVDWRRVNLKAGPEGLGRFDLILCRRQIGRLAAEARAAALAGLESALAAGGWLVLDDDETASGFAPAAGRPGVFLKAGLSAAA